MKEWLKERTEATACKREARKERMLSRASERAVQLMEYEGDLYVSHNGEPLLPIDCLKWGLPRTLGAMRGIWKEWHRERGREYGSY